MTIKVIPSTGAEITHQSSSAIARWGGQNWIVPGNVDLLASDEGLSGGPLNAAAFSTSGLDVTIDTFEAFVGGAWIGSDDSTASEHTHTLAGDGNEVTLYLGKDNSAEDTFIFGPSGDFSSSDPRMPVALADDDGSSATIDHDRRAVGYVDRPGTLLAANYDEDTTNQFTFGTGTLSETYEVYDIYLYRISHSPQERYARLQLNGSSSNIYNMKIFKGDDSTWTDIVDAGSFQRLAGTITDADGAGGYANQHIRVTCPRKVVNNSRHYPLVETVNAGVGYNIDHLHVGAFKDDTEEVDELQISGGGNSTGMIHIYGQSLDYDEPV